MRLSRWNPAARAVATAAGQGLAEVMEPRGIDGRVFGRNKGVQDRPGGTARAAGSPPPQNIRNTAVLGHARCLGQASRGGRSFSTTAATAR